MRARVGGAVGRGGRRGVPSFSSCAVRAPPTLRNLDFLSSVWAEVTAMSSGDLFGKAFLIFAVLGD